MRYLQIFMALFLTFLFISCKKDSNHNKDCLPNGKILRQITDQPATVKNINGQFYLVENNAVDSRLNPCNLDKDYQVDNLQVTISGEVKSVVQPGPGPCCTENFVITEISK